MLFLYSCKRSERSILIPIFSDVEERENELAVAEEVDQTFCPNSSVGEEQRRSEDGAVRIFFELCGPEGLVAMVYCR